MVELRTNHEKENAAIAWVIEKESQAGRQAMDVRHQRRPAAISSSSSWSASCRCTDTPRWALGSSSHSLSGGIDCRGHPLYASAIKNLCRSGDLGRSIHEPGIALSSCSKLKPASTSFT